MRNSKVSSRPSDRTQRYQKPQMRGRKPKPTHLKVLDGTATHNPSEPKPEPRVRTCPAHLCPSAKAEWKRLARMLFTLRIMTELDRSALAAYCQAYGRWVEAERKLQETPMLLKLPSVMCSKTRGSPSPTSSWSSCINTSASSGSRQRRDHASQSRTSTVQSRGSSAEASSMGCWVRSRGRRRMSF